MRNLHFQILCLVSLSCLLTYDLSLAIDTAITHAHPNLAGEVAPRQPKLSIHKRSIMNDYRERYYGVAFILPIQAAAQTIEETLDGIVGLAVDELAAGKPARWALKVGRDDVSVTFVSSNRNIPVPWEFIIYSCEALATGVSRG